VGWRAQLLDKSLNAADSHSFAPPDSFSAAFLVFEDPQFR
jgi:hypothetical protein